MPALTTDNHTIIINNEYDLKNKTKKQPIKTEPVHNNEPS